jgi:hypothetical protein
MMRTREGVLQQREEQEAVIRGDRPATFEVSVTVLFRTIFLSRVLKRIDMELIR